MLILGNDLPTAATVFYSKPTSLIEQVQFFLEGKSQDRVSAQEAVRSLQSRLDRLKRKAVFSGINKVELSNQVLNLIEN
jgi:hypothetical protein